MKIAIFPSPLDSIPMDISNFLLKLIFDLLIRDSYSADKILCLLLKLIRLF